MAETEKPRRKCPPPAPEYAVVEIMRRTYEVEKRRCNSQCLAVEFVPDTVPEVKPLGDMPSEKQRRIDNLEDKPKTVEDTHGRELKLWLKIAALVLEHKFDPATFIRRQFLVLPPGSKSPYIEAFNSDDAIANYDRGRVTGYEDIKIAFASQLSTFRTHVAIVLASVSRKYTSEEAWAVVLTDEYLALSALFRHCMALSVSREAKTGDKRRFTTIASRYATAAAIQYMLDAEAYNGVWEKMLPSGYGVVALQTYNAYYGFTH